MEKEDNLEKIRNKLNQMANPKNLLDKEVIDLSQELDKEVVSYYQKEGGTEMSGISIKKDRIIFYGNTAGYLNNGQAIVDPMFQCEELNDFLTKKQGLSVEWVNGVFDRLANGKQDFREQTVLKSCRIYQLKPEVNPMMKFIGYDELLEGGFGKPNPENYQIVYDGEIETNNLEDIFEKFNLHHPPDFQ